MLTLKPITRVLDVRLQTITPLHIGTGNILMKDIDFLAEGKQTRRLDVDRILTELWDESLSRRATPPRPAELLQTVPRAEWDHFTAYIAQGTIDASASGSQLQEQIKTADFEPYIPGSSIKGALRTALGWSGWPDVIQRRLDPQRDFNSASKFAGQPIEDKLFRPAKRDNDAPNKDLLRVLQIGDLKVTEFGNGYLICNVRVASRTKYDAPIEIEAVSRQTHFRGQWTLHESLFDNDANVLGLGIRKAWIDELIARVNQHSRAQLDWLKRDFSVKQLNGSKQQEEFCDGLQQDIAKLPADTCMLRVGWGAGWDNKTFSSRLSTAPASDLKMFEREVVQGYNLYPGKGTRQRGDPFPTTRRVIVRGRGNNLEIIDMFGWILIKLTPIER